MSSRQSDIVSSTNNPFLPRLTVAEVTMTLKGFSFTRYRQTYNRLSDDVDRSFGNLLLRKEYTAAIHGVLDLIQSIKPTIFWACCFCIDTSPRSGTPSFWKGHTRRP